MGGRSMKIARVSKRQERINSRKFTFVPDPNVVSTWLFRGIGSEARSKEHFRKEPNHAIRE